jgi:hypothetical protein
MHAAHVDDPAAVEEADGLGAGVHAHGSWGGLLGDQKSCLQRYSFARRYAYGRAHTAYVGLAI